MDAILQTEIVDERKSRLKSLEPTGAGSLGTLGLGAGLSTSALPSDFRIQAKFSNVQSTFNYDEMIAREFPPARASHDIRLVAVHPVGSADQFRSRESEWRRTHADTLKSLENQWVVLEGDQVVAHGEDPVQVINEAKAKGIRTPYIFFVEQRTENVVTMGLWGVVVVSYLHEFNCVFQDGRFPILQLQVCDPDNSENKIDVDAYLDSGAERSLFNGFLITSLGRTLINDKIQRYDTTAGNSIEAYLHHVQLNLPGVGLFNLEIGFSNFVIRRNLLGRDFFNLTQIGFRENHLKYYLTPTP